MFSKDEYISLVETINLAYSGNWYVPPTPTLLGDAQSVAPKYAQINKKSIELDTSNDPKLKKIGLEKIRSIIFHLEGIEKVLKSYPPRRYLTSTTGMVIPHYEETPHILNLDIYTSFESWYKRFKSIRDRQISDLSQLNYEKILGLVRDIDEKIQLNPAGKMEIFLSSNNNPPLLAKTISNYHENYQFRDEALKYLYDEFVVISYKIRTSEFAPAVIELTVNTEEFLKFKKKLEKPSDIPQASSNSSEEIVYTLTYDEMTGAIALNNKVLKKTNLGSLADSVFTYLHKNANRRITLSELKKATKKDIKDLPKVIENAGFTGNRLKAFFGRVSKDSVYFKPQISKADLEKLGITSLD